MDTTGSLDVLSPKPRSILKDVEIAKRSRELPTQPPVSSIASLNEFGRYFQNLLKNSRRLLFRGANFSISETTHFAAFLFFCGFPAIGIESLKAKLSVWWIALSRETSISSIARSGLASITSNVIF
jgi:hypothetical protein